MSSNVKLTPVCDRIITDGFWRKLSEISGEIPNEGQKTERIFFDTMSCLLHL